jgi:predicted dehydrogenase
MPGEIPRRTFVGEMAALGAAFHIVPRHVLGGRRFKAPSDTLNVACIGVGGMGATDVRGMAEENIHALCDVDDERAAESYERFPRAKRYKDFRVMLERERENIDAVTISTPDHTHTVAALMALRLGKHVYCQKPLTRTIGEARTLVDAARGSRVATQMGNQGHSWEGTRQIREWVEAGWIGTVREVQYWTNRPIWPQAIERPLEAFHVPPHLDWDLWLGPAPARPYHPSYAPFKWRGWWDYGTGALGDIACHAMDAAFWALNLGYPARVEAESTPLFEETAPAMSRIVYQFPATGSRQAVTVVWRDGSLGPSRPEGLAAGARWPAGTSGQLWVGDEGGLVAGIYGENPRLLDDERHAALLADPPGERYPRTKGVYAEWIAACKSGGKAGSDFAEHAGPLTEMVLLGNLALRTGTPLEIDPRTGTVTNATIPEEYVAPTYRQGWAV